jgi:hypothetical protein
VAALYFGMNSSVNVNCYATQIILFFTHTSDDDNSLFELLTFSFYIYLVFSPHIRCTVNKIRFAGAFKILNHLYRSDDVKFGWCFRPK